jgi:hypothetical protein
VFLVVAGGAATGDETALDFRPHLYQFADLGFDAVFR